MTASFPAVRLGRLNGRFGNTVFLTHDGPFPVVGQGPNFFGGLNENGTGSVPSVDVDQRP